MSSNTGAPAPPGVGEPATEFRLTPLLAMGTTPSPWSLIDWNKVPGTTPTPAQASIHKLEHNRFENSFGAAIYQAPTAADEGGAAVPQMTAVPASYSAGVSSALAPNDRDRVVPAGPATTAVPKRKSSSNKAGKSTTKAKSKSSTKAKRPVISDKERREKRREQNRRNAAKCRQRKLDRVSTLTEELDGLKQENDKLKASLEILERKMAERKR
jgi:hypothetical protein